MPRRTTCLAALAVVALVGCSAGIDPAAKADIDRRVALLPSPSQPFPAPGAALPLPLAVGQWVQYKVTDERGQPSFLTIKVVDELQSVFWIEYVSESYSGRAVTKMNLYAGDRSKLEVMDVRALRTMDAKGTVTETPPEGLAEVKTTFGNLLAMLVVAWQGLPQEEVRVPAGVFGQCFKGRSEAALGPTRAASLSWSHPAVPLTGLVRSRGVDRPTAMELVAFGEKGGGKSEIP
jgi:hypothetical protein